MNKFAFTTSNPPPPTDDLVQRLKEGAIKNLSEFMETLSPVELVNFYVQLNSQFINFKEK